MFISSGAVLEESMASSAGVVTAGNPWRSLVWFSRAVIRGVVVVFISSGAVLEESMASSAGVGTAVNLVILPPLLGVRLRD